MKSNKSSKNLKTATRVLTIAICIGLAFSLITVQQTDAILVTIGVFIGGFIIGWFLAQDHDSSSPDALVTSQENYVLVWNDFIEGWNNDYTGENVNLANYMMMYNLTYLDSVRRAEHDVASYVHLLNWTDVESNMSSLTDYKENITKFIISTLHGYNRVDVSILQHMYDTNTWSYTTPTKLTSKAWHKSLNGLYYGDSDLDFYGDDGIIIHQYKPSFGTYPVGYDGDYNIGDKFYITFLYVPNGNFIILKDLDSSVETTYYHGVYDLQGGRNEVINVTMFDYENTGANGNLDNTGVYLFGLPTDFDVLEDNFITYNTGLEGTTESQTILFESNKFIKDVEVSYYSYDTTDKTFHLYINGVFVRSVTGDLGTITTIINDYVTNITTIPIDSGIEVAIISITTEGYIYHYTTSGLRVDTELAGSAYVTDGLPARGRVGLDWMVNSYKNIYESMIVQSKILWNVYHANGWYTTDDIPSEFLVVPPDIIFDNMDALTNLPLDKAQAIYYAWMGQMIDFYDENPDYAGTYDDTNQTVFDVGIIFNASLVHGNKTIFNNHEIYISPLLSDLSLCINNSYNLTQKIFIYDITANYIYYGYVDDNLTIYNITVEGAGTDCITLNRQTMHDFLLGEYGFSISFPAEWEFPVVGEPTNIYGIVGIGLICLGIPILALGGKKYSKIGIVMVLIGSGIVIYIYVIPAVLDFIVFW